MAEHPLTTHRTGPMPLGGLNRLNYQIRRQWEHRLYCTGTERRAHEKERELRTDI